MAKSVKTKDAARTVGAPWWLDAGEEDCPHCDQTYTFRVEARCIECDAPICPMCIVRVEQHLLCPDCHDADKAQ
jgi:hypothetical protein